MTKYDITAKPFNRVTGKPAGKSRTERIDTETNSLFRNCKTILSAEQAYEAFWNDVNPVSRERVFVSRVNRI